MSAPQPIVICRSVNREGQTLALKPTSRHFLRQKFGASVPSSAGVSIAHDTQADFDEWQSNVAEQVIQPLTDVAPGRLERFGDVVFRDRVTETDTSAT